MELILGISQPPNNTILTLHVSFRVTARHVCTPTLRNIWQALQLLGTLMIVWGYYLKATISLCMMLFPQQHHSLAMYRLVQKALNSVVFIATEHISNLQVIMFACAYNLQQKIKINLNINFHLLFWHFININLDYFKMSLSPLPDPVLWPCPPVSDGLSSGLPLFALGRPAQPELCPSPPSSSSEACHLQLKSKMHEWCLRQWCHLCLSLK